MNANIKIIFGFLIFAVNFSSCRFYYKEKAPQGDTSTTLSSDAKTKISYQMVREKIFAPKCISCHGDSGGINLESYASTKQNLSSIERTALIDKTMPKNGPLSTSEANFLSSWISQGAPENIDAGAPTPEPQEPFKPTFTSLKKKIFDIRCMSCHSGTAPEGDVSFESLDALRGSPRQPLEMEDEGDPDTSGLVLAITREDSKQMPPPDQGEKLSEEEILTIRQWIKEAAPE